MIIFLSKLIDFQKCNEFIVFVRYFRMVLVGLSFSALYLSKKSIDNRRYEDYKVRQRMRDSNKGDYNRPDKFVKHTEEQN